MALSAALKARIQSEFPGFASLIDIPDIANLLGKAVTEGWDVGKLQANLFATKWWKTNSEAQRNAAVLYRTDRASYNAELRRIKLNISAEAKRLGARITIGEWAWISTRAMNEGWTPEEITRAILTTSGKRTTNAGTLRATTSEVWAMSKAYGIPVSSQWAAAKARSVAEGTQTLDAIKNYFHERALWKYASEGNEFMKRGLEQGNTVWDVMQPTLGLVAEELEIPIEAFDLTKGLAAKLINYKDADTGQTRVATESEALQTARSDRRWRDTRGSKALATETSNAISRFMGAKV